MSELGAAGWVAPVSAWLLTYLLHSSVVVGVVWGLVRMGWVHRPTTQDLLWKVALVAALATASVAVLASTRPVRAVRTGMVVEGRAQPAPEAVVWQESGAAPPRRLEVRAIAVEPSPACRAALARLLDDLPQGGGSVRQACQARGGIGWRELFLAAWLLGAVGLLVRGVGPRRSVRRGLEGAYPAAAHLQCALRGLLPGSGRNVTLLVSPAVDVPCVVGRRVLLPVRCVQELTPEEITAALAHEVAHVVRRDPAWLNFGDLLSRILWVQPLNRLALDRLRESAELICDDWAVDRTRRPLELASSIARVAEWIHPARRAPASALAHLTHLAHGEGRALSTRVRRILTANAARRSAPRPLRFALALLVVAPTFAVPAVRTRPAIEAVFVRREAAEGGPSPFAEVRGDDVRLRIWRGEPADS